MEKRKRTRIPLSLIKYAFDRFGNRRGGFALWGINMIVKRCMRCGKNIPVGKKCDCFLNKYSKPSHSDKYSPDIKQFYKTAEWIKARNLCIHKCFGIDLYSYFINQRIEYGQTVHHIVPLINDYSLRTAQSNLIYLTESNHRIIHKLYETDYSGTVRILHDLLRKFPGVI